MAFVETSKERNPAPKCWKKVGLRYADVTGMFNKDTEAPMKNIAPFYLDKDRAVADCE